MIVLLFITAFLSLVAGVVLGSMLTAASVADRVAELERVKRRALIEGLEEAVRE